MNSNVSKKKTLIPFSSFSLFTTIFILFILNIKIKYINCQHICSDFNLCPKCSLCGDEKNPECDCEWKEAEQQCVDKTSSNFGLREWQIELSSSCDIEKEYSYCKTKSSYTLEDFVDDQIKIEINQDDNGYYGQYFKLCKFELTDGLMENSYQISIDYSQDNKVISKPTISFTYRHLEGDIQKEKTETITDNYEESFSQTTCFTFIVLFKDNYNFMPVSITITITSNLKAKLLASFLIGLVFIILIFALICCTSNYLNRRTREHLRLLRAQRDLQIFQPMQMGNEDDQERIKEENTAKLNKIFEVLMPEHLYKKEYNQYGGGCSICLENFNKKSKVSITSCNHVFHYKCINEWLFKNIFCPKCPNCNHEILNDYDNINNMNNMNNYCYNININNDDSNSNGEECYNKNNGVNSNTLQIRKRNDNANNQEQRKTLDLSGPNQNIDISVAGMRGSISSTKRRIFKKKKKN